MIQTTIRQRETFNKATSIIKGLATYMPRFNSSTNVIGSIPEYGVMIDYIIGRHTCDENFGEGFKFRTEKSFKRFDAAIYDSLLRFPNADYEKMFFNALMSGEFSMKDKLMVLFWQLVYANDLFREISANVFMKAVYDGRSVLLADEVLSFLRHLKEENPGELTWSEGTLKIVPSKYLTTLKKLGLAEGTVRKSICYPSMPSHLFIYFVKWVALASESSQVSIDNKLFQFGFYDIATLASRLKKIEFTPYWDITQIGNDIRLEIKPIQDANI